MGIGVARRAVLREPEEAARLVARAALDAGVCSGEREAGELVIERLHPARAPVNQLKGAAVMFIVAALASPIAGLRVQAALRLKARTQRGVAGQTFRRAHPFAGLVALQAVRGALELRVRLRQFSGRDLPARCSGDQQRHEQHRRTLHRNPYPVSITTATCTIMKRYITTANGL
jgi:hypothetical protein